VLNVRIESPWASIAVAALSNAAFSL